MTSKDMHELTQTVSSFPFSVTKTKVPDDEEVPVPLQLALDLKWTITVQHLRIHIFLVPQPILPPQYF